MTNIEKKARKWLEAAPYCALCVTQPCIHQVIAFGQECADEARREAEARTGYTYPHMCRTDHPQIGHSTDEEMCPVCIERGLRGNAEIALAEAKGEGAEDGRTYRQLLSDYDAMTRALADERRRGEAMEAKLRQIVSEGGKCLTFAHEQQYADAKVRAAEFIISLARSALSTPPAPEAKGEARPAPISDEDERRICWSCRADKAGCRAWRNGCCPDCDHWRPAPSKTAGEE